MLQQMVVLIRLVRIALLVVLAAIAISLVMAAALRPVELRRSCWPLW